MILISFLTLITPIMMIIEKELNQFLTVCKGHHNKGNDT
jgi:hypothetical protein